MSRGLGDVYKRQDGRRLVAVYTNMGNKPVRLAVSADGWADALVSVFTTSASKNLAGVALEKGAQVVLDPQSVTTVVYDL